MRLIDADALKEAIKEWRYHGYYDKLIEVIDNAPTVITNSVYEAYCKITDEEFEHSDSFWITTPKGKKINFVKERPQGECKTCKYYHPYFEQFTNIPRGDGYCVIARMTPEGMTTINCNDEFGCSDYQKGGRE